MSNSKLPSIYEVEKSTHENEEINKLKRRISLLKQRNCMLAKENQRLFVLQQILRLIPEHVYWKDENGVYEGCNEQFSKTLGFNSVNEIIGKREEDINQTIAEQIIKNDAEIIKNNKSQVVEEIGNNNEVYLSHKSPLHNKEGKPYGVVGISINITERKKMEKDLQKAKESAEFSNQVKTDMIRNLSHDIRTPLTGIIGQANLIGSEYPETKKEIQELQGAAQKLLDLLNSIMDVSQLESGNIVEKFTQFSMQDLINDIVTCFKPTAQDKKLQLKSYLDGELSTQIIGNYHFIHRIIFNLVGNSLKFTDKGNVTLHIESTKKDNQNVLLKISVKDTGIGIPKDKQAIIFEPFNRLTPSYENRYPGNGLGLFMVSELVRKLAGEIHVNSIVGEGTTFKVLIPVKSALEIKEPSTAAAEVIKMNVPLSNPTISVSSNLQESEKVSHNVQNEGQKKIRVLLVEDDNLAQKTGGYNLNAWGYQVETASNGTQALEQTLKEKFDFIYMDIGLPDLNGDKVAQKIRQDKYNLNQFTPIVALTAHADNSITQECLAIGMNEVLQKPMQEESTKRVIEQYVKKLTIIDLAEGARIINGDEKAAKEMIELLTNQLSKQQKAIIDAFNNHDDEQLQYHVHKLHGGTCYCGVPRLRLAAKMFEHALRAKQQNIAPLFNQLMEEIQAFMDECHALNISVKVG